MYVILEAKLNLSNSVVEKNLNIRYEINKKNNDLFCSITEEVKINYSDIIDFSFEKTIKYKSDGADTIPVFKAKWSKNVSNEFIDVQESKIKKWIKFKLTNDSFILNREIEL